MENENITPTSEAQSGDNKVLMGILSYLGPLVIISYLTSKNNSFVKFHIKQGLVLFVAEVILWAVSSYFWPFRMIFSLIELGIFILAIIGIINVINKKEVPVPVLGSFSKHFNI